MDTVTVGCVLLEELSRYTPGRFSRRERLAFLVEPVPLDQARAHLEIAAPDGAVVIAKRGPKGGWGTPRYTSSGRRLRERRGVSFHIVVGGCHEPITDDWTCVRNLRAIYSYVAERGLLCP